MASGRASPGTTVSLFLVRPGSVGVTPGAPFQFCRTQLCALGLGRCQEDYASWFDLSCLAWVWPHFSSATSVYPCVRNPYWDRSTCPYFQTAGGDAQGTAAAPSVPWARRPHHCPHPSALPPPRRALAGRPQGRVRVWAGMRDGLTELNRSGDGRSQRPGRKARLRGPAVLRLGAACWERGRWATEQGQGEGRAVQEKIPVEH